MLTDLLTFFERSASFINSARAKSSLSSIDKTLDFIFILHKKKRNLALLLITINKYQDTNYKWFGNKKINYEEYTLV